MIYIMYYIKVLFLFLFISLGQAAIQLDESCTKRPQACDDDAFSVADFVICSGTVFGDEVEGAKKGTGKLAAGCNFNEECVKVFPTDEIDTDNWGTDAVATGCENVVMNGLVKTDEALAAKKAACKKWMAPDTGVCQVAIWFPITLIVVIALLAIGLTIFYLLKNPNKQPEWLKKMLEKRAENQEKEQAKQGMYKRRNARVFDDGI